MARHITLTCPNCETPDRAVGDPNADPPRWYCFACGAHGTYDLGMHVVAIHDQETDEAPLPELP